MLSSEPTQRVFQIRLPMRVASSKRKLDALNLNVYRNLHHRSLHAQKKNFTRDAMKLVKGLPFMECITLHYDIYPKTKRRLDIMNVGSIIDKYFSDTLVEAGIIPDDDLRHVTHISFGFGGLSEKEHVLVTITETSKTERSKEPMRILLDENDIQEALTAHVETMGIPGANGVEISVEDGNLIAEVTFGETEEKPTPAPKTTKSRGGRPKGSRNKPKPKEEEAEPDVAETGTSSSAGDDAGAGETPEPEAGGESEAPKSKPKSDASKNLFGDEENESSKTDVPEEEASTGGEEAPVKPPKKSSIFDT